MPRFCRRQFFPNDLGGKRIHVDHRKYVNSENERFCYDFCAFVVQSLCVQLIVLKKFSVINSIFQKCIIKLPDDTAILAKTLGFIYKIRKTRLLSF